MVFNLFGFWKLSKVNKTCLLEKARINVPIKYNGNLLVLLNFCGGALRNIGVPLEAS